MSFCHSHNVIKWITDLNVKCKTRELVEDKIAENLNNLGFGSKFFSMLTPRTRSVEK
jgi:hypothetical protein